MNGLIETARSQQRHFVVLVCMLVIVVGALLAIGQPIAAVLVPLIAVLAVELRWRDQRARALAQRLMMDQASDKIEVPRGAWGELARAVNGLQQQRRIQERLQVATAAPLPDDAVRAILDGSLPSGSEPRIVTVLLVSCGDAHRADPRRREALLSRWQALAQTAQAQAHAQGALLQPCGDALLLVFGAFTERPAHTTAQAALQVADQLRQVCQSRTGFPLALSMASGSALVAVLPGLGYCVLGAPIDQVIEMERMALNAPSYDLLCDESAYYALKPHARPGWAATSFQVDAATGRPQAVYGRQRG